MKRPMTTWIYCFITLFCLTMSGCKPVATAISVGTTPGTPVDIILSGTDSDGDKLTFKVTVPPVHGTLSGESPELTYMPEKGFIGTDQFEYVANDGSDDSDPAIVTITVNNTPVPVVDKRLDVIGVGDLVQLDASESFDIEGDDITYNWAVVSAPEGGISEALITDGPQLSFVPEVKGHYVIALQLSDDFGASPVLEVNILTDAYEFYGLDFLVTDAEQDTVNDRIVFVSSDSSSLYVYNMHTHEVAALELPYAPTCVAVAVSGDEAVVGHTEAVSHVSLDDLTIINTFSVSIDVSDIVLTHGMAVLMPKTDQWVKLYSLDLATGEEIIGTGTVRANTQIKLHPSGDYAYGADRGLSPSDIEKYDVSASPVSVLYDSPYHGDYAMCGELWIDPNGKRIFTGCGNVFSSSELKDQDMRYMGKLDGQSGLVWVSARGDSVYTIDSNDTRVSVLSSLFLTLSTAYELPMVSAGNDQYPTHGHYVFPYSTGLSHSVVVKADDGSGLLYDWGVADWVPSAMDAEKPEADISGNASVVLGGEIDLDGSASQPGGGKRLWYFWDIVSSPEGSGLNIADKISPALEFSADIAGDYHIVLVVFDGEKYSDAKHFTVHAVDTSTAYEVPIDLDVVDAEYNEVMDKVVIVSSSPSQLTVFDPFSLEQKKVTLPLVPTSVGTSLDGTMAVVGHNGWITQIDLDTANIVNYYNTTADVFDVVVTHGYAHLMPRVDQWEYIRSIDLSTGVETLSSGNLVRAGTVMKLHPSGDYAYGADRGLSPSDIEKYDLSGGTADYMYDSPYHGDYGMCGNLWIGEDGLRIITGCGNIFRSSSSEDLDMTYNGALSSVSDIQWVSHSQEQDAMMVLHSDNRVATFRYSDTELLEDEPLPMVQLQGETIQAQGEFAFYDSTGERRIFILKVQTSGAAQHAVYVD